MWQFALKGMVKLLVIRMIYDTLGQRALKKVMKLAAPSVTTAVINGKPQIISLKWYKNGNQPIAGFCVCRCEEEGT